MLCLEGGLLSAKCAIGARLEYPIMDGGRAFRISLFAVGFWSAVVAVVALVAD